VKDAICIHDSLGKLGRCFHTSAKSFIRYVTKLLKLPLNWKISCRG